MSKSNRVKLNEAKYSEMGELTHGHGVLRHVEVTEPRGSRIPRWSATQRTNNRAICLCIFRVRKLSSLSQGSLALAALDIVKVYCCELEVFSEIGDESYTYV